jgi:hypothetical protein
MHMKLRRHTFLTLLLGSLLALCGCTTTELWTETNLKGPSGEPQLRVYDSPRHNDFLVVYNEGSDRDGRVRRRAYYLNRFEERGVRSPKFVAPGRAKGLDPLPLLEPQAGLSVQTNSGLSVVLETNHVEFAIWNNGRELGVYRLPEYRDPADSPRKFFLTPVALAIDAVILAAIAGLLYLWVVSSDDDP